ncbi:MAG: carbohydrate binding family 9 domain-containing protein [Gemmatimonadetes bacterium]|nr:carbohydrate binding family 9 domain-containing protein [Gemmatimonadota bacterium]
MIPLLLLAQSLGGDPAVYDGLKRQLDVHPPRIEATATVDGALDEPAWGQVALLTGFSQYQPVDGRPAEDSTQVLVWYSPNAMYFGIRGYESHGAVHATLAQRDHIESDDYIQIMLDTFYDRRRVLVFGINPLGVQSDGVRAEGQVSAPGAMPGQVDLNPDFVYESKGRVTPFGFEIEVRIPFKSLRYQSVAVQTWGINVLRRVQHSGYDNTWTPARRANASFISQEGTLSGLTEMKRGLVLELNPFATGRADGLPGTTPGGGWHYDASPDAGLNLRWGATPNLTLDGTINPDFSQVEGDVAQVAADPRFALFYPEKRPFFLEGLDQFSNPNRLIYTRQIVSPEGGLKLTGKVSGTNIAVISALDDTAASFTGSHPLYNLFRVRRDVGRQSSVGVVYTDKIDGANFNRVAAADSRIIFRRMYYAEFQAGMSATRSGGVTTRGPLATATVDRTGRKWGFHYTFLAFDPDFQAQSGFVSRTGIVQWGAANRFTWYGRRGAVIEALTTRPELTGVWKYSDFLHGSSPLETRSSVTATFTLRGGWTLEAKPAWESYAFDPAVYAAYGVRRVVGATADTVRYVVPGRVSGVYGSTLRLATPRFRQFSADVTVYPKRDIDFREGAVAPSLSVNATLDWRPNEKIRISPLVSHLHRNRARDGTRIESQSVGRLKLEYQLSRPIFLRFVGQYTAQERDALRDPRTDEPILLYSAGRGAYVATTRQTTNSLRVDWLFSYQPNPGTVIFAGYGNSLTEPDAFSFSDLRRVSDGFFVKVSYLFRV